MKRFLALLVFCASVAGVALADSPAGNGSGSSVTVTSTPNVNVLNTPGVTVQNTPNVNVQNATPATPDPVSAGAAPTSAPAVISEPLCAFNTSVTPATSGQVIHEQCDAYGRMKIAPWLYFAITTTTTTLIKSGPGVLAGVFNLSTAAQPAGLCTLYDSATTTITGTQILFQENQIGSNQQYTEPQGGLFFINGLAEACFVAPTTGLMVQYR